MNIKKVIALGMVATLAISSLVACGKKTTETNNGNTEANKKFKIGVIQLVEHNALDAAYDGFVTGLEDAGYKDGDNIEIVFKNAQGEQANCATIAAQLVNDKCDLILAIATPAAQAVANETSDIPILVTAVTDPADAKLVKSNEAPGTNVTGTSDLTPVEKQMDLLQKIVPDAKKVAMLYCSAEANSKFQINLAKKACEELGLETVDATVSDSSEIRQVVESLKGKVDAIYAPTDNVIAAGMSTVSMVANEIQLPTIVGEEGMCLNGGLATYGINYEKLGIQTAGMAVKILEGESTPDKMPIEYLEDVDLIINSDTATALNITIPADLEKEAKFVTTKAAE